MRKSILSLSLAAGLALAALPGSAAVITVNLGNTSPGFANCAVPDLLTEILLAQTGQPVPFDQGYGNENLEDFTASWTFTYGAVAGTITSATISIGIVDHDSAASGSQLLSFLVDGGNQTALLNALFEGSGGTDGEYNIYTVTLPGSLFAALANGSAPITLTLQGPGLAVDLFAQGGPAVVETTFNGAFLINSTLEITTEDIPEVPEPSAYILLLSGLGGLAWVKRGK